MLFKLAKHVDFTRVDQKAFLSTLSWKTMVFFKVVLCKRTTKFNWCLLALVGTLLSVCQKSYYNKTVTRCWPLLMHDNAYKHMTNCIYTPKRCIAFYRNAHISNHLPLRFIILHWGHDFLTFNLLASQFKFGVTTNRTWWGIVTWSGIVSIVNWILKYPLTGAHSPISLKHGSFKHGSADRQKSSLWHNPEIGA